MTAKPDKILFSRFFNAYDTGGTQHTGFFQNFDFSDTYSDLDILTDVVGSLLDAYLYNEYSKRYVVSTWAAYMTWDKTNKRYNIDADFYDDFVKAFCGHVLTAENFYQLTKFDWDECIEVIEKTLEYGNHVKTRERGNDTSTMSDRRDTHHLDYAQQHTKTENDIKKRKTVVKDDIVQHREVNSNVYGTQESDVTTENDKAAFNTTVGTYVNDTKIRVHGDNVKSHTDTLTTTTDPYLDTQTTEEDPYKDQIDVTADAHHDTMTDDIGAQTKTDTHGTVTDRSNEHTDTETTTKTTHYDNERLFQIQKELAALNVYKIVGDAVAATMLTLEWGW